MTVLPYPMNTHLRGMHGNTAANATTSTNTAVSRIQPSVNVILDHARGSDQHIVRLYYLPTPDTNGFTTTHTLVSTSNITNTTTTTDRNYTATGTPTAITAAAIAVGRSRSSSCNVDLGLHHEQKMVFSEVEQPSRRHSRVSHLTRVSESERGIVHLARLRITNMIIPTSSLPFLSHLVSLRLQGNMLRDIPLQIFRLPSLRELDVSQNLLTEISGLIGRLAPTLEELFLQSNRLESLPQQLGHLKKLRLLDIADNQLGCIPVEVQRLVSESSSTAASARVVGMDEYGGNRRRRSLWRVNETGSSSSLSSLLDNNINNVYEDAAHVHILDEGSTSNTATNNSSSIHHPPQSPAEFAYAAATTTGSGIVALNHAVLMEEGGHDDDDYVQIRQGMKCWARGNRFWQVKAPSPRSSLASAMTNTMDITGAAPMSPITATTTMLLAGSTSPSSLSPSQASVPFFSEQGSSTLGHMTPPIASMESLSLSPVTTAGVNDHGHSMREANNQHAFFQDPYHHRHLGDDRYQSYQPSRQQPYFPANQHQHYHRRMSHPEHLVDRRGYSKDSYTSCSWAMSLADICAQIVGEKLFEDPHYFCHSSSCPHKTKSKMSQRFKREKMYADASFVDRQGNHGQEYNKTWKDERVEQMEECTIMMMPDWMIEQLGLEHLSEIQQPFFPDSSSSDPLSTERTSDNDDELFTGNNAITVSEASARTHQTRSDLLTRLPAPMELTLQEKEMGSEFCSVCQKRLYFAGMRWKGVGVMDERIVPLEWVACSVQCRARAEHGDRRDDINSYNEKRSHGSHQDYQSRHHAIDRNHDSNAGYGSGRTFSSAAEPPSSSSSTLSTLPGASGSVGSSRAFRSTSLSVTSSASSSISSGRGRHLEGGIQNGNSTRVNHDGQLQNQSQDQGQGQLFSSPLQSPSLSPALTAPSLSDAGGTGRVRVGTEGNGVGHGSPAANATTTSSVPVVHHRHRPPQEQQHQHQHQQLQVQQRHHQRYHQQDQRIYRETDLYGLIKSRALRRRARTLSL